MLHFLCVVGDDDDGCPLAKCYYLEKEAYKNNMLDK